MHCRDESEGEWHSSDMWLFLYVNEKNRVECLEYITDSELILLPIQREVLKKLRNLKWQKI